MVIDVWPWKPRNAELGRIVWMLNRSHNLIVCWHTSLLIFVFKKMLNISASLSRSLFCITAIFHHASQPSISPTPFIILDHLDHGHPPSCLALAFGTNHRVHGRHFSLAPFRWANPRRVLGIGSLECVFHVSIFLHRYSGKFIIYIYIYIYS